jgi:hypothetical protein
MSFTESALLGHIEFERRNEVQITLRPRSNSKKSGQSA